jgi:hypothetical protein
MGKTTSNKPKRRARFYKAFAVRTDHQARRWRKLEVNMMDRAQAQLKERRA